MNLNEMLIYADIDGIKRIADNYRCQFNRNSKTEAIQAILYQIFSKDVLEEQIEQLDEAEYIFIQLLFFDNRHQLSIEDLLTKGKQAIDIVNSNIKPRSLVLLALKNGWIFQGVGKKYIFFYLIPEDLKNSILEVLYSKLIKTMNIKTNVNFYKDESKLMIADLLSFLKYVKNEKVLLTNEGNIYKRQQHKIIQSFQIQEEILDKIAWRFGYGRRYNEYPDRFSLIYDYAFYNKLIYEDEEGYLIVTPRSELYLNKYNLKNEEMDIYKFWIKIYKYPIPYIQYLVKTIDLVAYNNWIQIDTLEENVLFWLKDHYYEDKHQIFRERIIKMLMHLGCIQISNDKKKIYIKITDEGHKWINGNGRIEEKK